MQSSDWHKILASVCGIAFLALTLWAVAGHYLPGEQAGLLTIITHRDARLDQGVLVVSALGSINVLLPLWAITVVGFAFTRNGLAVVRLLPVPLGYPLYAAIKVWIARPGPTPPEYPRLNDLSLGYFVEGLLRNQLQQLPPQGVDVPVIQQPVTEQAVTRVMESGYVSGHALLALLFYGTLAWLIWQNLPIKSLRWTATGVCLMLAFSVGLARLYMGVHFPSDVLGAWLLAILSILLARPIARVLVARSSGWLAYLRLHTGRLVR